MSTGTSALAAARGFVVPPEREATRPPEARGLRRDEVRLAVARPHGTEHTTARDLARWLDRGDLLVVNTSATLPSALEVGRAGRGGRAGLHVSTQLDDGAWVVELRRSDGLGPAAPDPGEVLRLPGGVRLRVHSPHPEGQSRLWRAVPLPPTGRAAYLAAHGRPIRYRYLDDAYPLDTLQNVYATVPGSAEMASAGRPLSRRVLVDLVAKGVVVAPLVLHTGVSSQEAHEPPQPERYAVPEPTAALVEHVRARGGRVVGVGTTVVRALETVARTGALQGWTSLVLGPEEPARVVDGLLTGLHEPEASHLALLEAVAGERLVSRAYADITAPGAPPYLWHEYGDSMLLLP